jgi:hypothetical protein
VICLGEKPNIFSSPRANLLSAFSTLDLVLRNGAVPTHVAKSLLASHCVKSHFRGIFWLRCGFFSIGAGLPGTPIFTAKNSRFQPKTQRELASWLSSQDRYLSSNSKTSNLARTLKLLGSSGLVECLDSVLKRGTGERAPSCHCCKRPASSGILARLPF